MRNERTAMNISLIPIFQFICINEWHNNKAILEETTLHYLRIWQGSKPIEFFSNKFPQASSSFSFQAFVSITILYNFLQLFKFQDKCQFPLVLVNWWQLFRHLRNIRFVNNVSCHREGYSPPVLVIVVIYKIRLQNVI